MPVRPPRSHLSGEVEVDETMIGNVEEDSKREQGTSKEIVVIAVENKHQKGFRRIRMRHVPDASAKSLVPFVPEMIAPGSIVCTDAWRGTTPVAPMHEIPLAVPPTSCLALPNAAVHSFCDKKPSQ